MNDHEFSVVQLLGGPQAATASLDEHFGDNHNRLDKEPSHHYGYLYNFTGQPWKTQARVRQIAATAYSNTVEGVLGNHPTRSSMAALSH